MTKSKKNMLSKRSKKVRKSRKIMKGGVLSQNDEQELSDMGYNQQQIDDINDNNISMNIMNEAFNFYNQNINNAHNIIIAIAKQIKCQNYQDDNDSISAGPLLNEEDLNMSIDSQNSEDEDENNNQNNYDNDEGDTDFESQASQGGKRKKTRKNRGRRQKGGMCYGKGVGANSYDPNYSIYNTNMLKLFPYRPDK